MVCTEVPNQIEFVSRPHPTASRTDFIYIQTLVVKWACLRRRVISRMYFLTWASDITPVFGLVSLK
jgi:hypothetical protein